MHNSPKSLDVTVVTPTFNRADLITRALDSVRTQTSPPARIIIVDDASTDGTPDIVRRWAAHHNFPVTVESLTCNGGPAMARNRGIELSTTEYVAFLDSDDEHLPGTLKRLVTPLDALPEAALSFADATIVTPTTREPHGLFRPRIKLNTEAEPLQFPGLDIRALIDATSTLLKASIIPTSATCFRRKAALAAGLMPADFRSGEDWLFWLRLSKQGRFVFQLDDLALHHRHDGNLTHARAAEFVAREKLRGFLALESGTIGIQLTPEQRLRLEALRDKQLVGWRYHLSLLGVTEYIHGLTSTVAHETAPLHKHLLADPKSLLRSLICSVRT
jgi:glycosyltransferase involved in cell wall biosynthesis